mgnify:CR=1 FL=1
MFRYLKYDSNNSMLLPIHCIPYSTHHPIMGHLYSPGKGVYGLFTGSKVQARRVLTKNLPLSLTGERILSQKT